MIYYLWLKKFASFSYSLYIPDNCLDFMKLSVLIPWVLLQTKQLGKHSEKAELSFP